MAQFTDITITRAGLDMIAKSQAGDNLIFTGIKIGDGQIRGQSIPDLTDLISVKKEIPIISVTAKNEGHVEILGIIDNEDISVGFFVREIGIYAKINEGGTPALYGYTNAGNYASYISDKSVPMDAFKFKIDLVVGNAANVSFVSDKSIVYVTQENLDAHNESEDSHPDIRKKITAHENRFELFEKIADFGNDIIKNMALTTVISAITALETNSWFGQLLKMVLTASGVKYNIAQNGYVCLGSFFGGLIIQWIIAKGPMVNWPIAFTKCYGAIPVSYGTIGNKSAQKAEYGMRGAIAFDEIGIDSWYVGYFGIGIISQSQ